MLENKKHQILWDFVIQTDRLIQTKIADLESINKKNRKYHFRDFVISADQRGKVYVTVQIPGPCESTEQVMEHEGDSNTSHSFRP